MNKNNGTDWYAVAGFLTMVGLSAVVAILAIVGLITLIT